MAGEAINLDALLGFLKELQENLSNRNNHASRIGNAHSSALDAYAQHLKNSSYADLRVPEKSQDKSEVYQAVKALRDNPKNMPQDMPQNVRTAIDDYIQTVKSYDLADQKTRQLAKLAERELGEGYGVLYETDARLVDDSLHMVGPDERIIKISKDRLTPEGIREHIKELTAPAATVAAEKTAGAVAKGEQVAATPKRPTPPIEKKVKIESLNPNNKDDLLQLRRRLAGATLANDFDQAEQILQRIETSSHVEQDWCKIQREAIQLMRRRLPEVAKGEQAAAGSVVPPAAESAGKSAAAATGNAAKQEGQVAKAGEAAEGLWARFVKMHWGGKAAIIGGTAAVVGGAGYWALKEKNPEGNEQQSSAVR